MKLGFNKKIGEVFYITPQGNEVNIFMTEDINHEGIQSLIEQYNADYSISCIKRNLEQDDRFTGDEVDYVIEQLELFEEGQEQAQDTPEEDKMPWDEKVKEFNMVVYAAISNTSREKEEDVDLQKVEQPKVEKKERKKREPKTDTTPVQGTDKKALTPQDYIQLLEEKIKLTKILSETSVPGIPEDITKGSRDLMIQFSTDYNKLIVEYLEKIQSL